MTAEELINAVARNDIGYCQKWLDDGHDLNILHGAIPPLHWAQTTEMQKFLIKNGADINAKYHGTTVLHKAIRSGKEKSIRAILEGGPDCNLIDNHGLSALHVAIEHGSSLECIQELASKINNIDLKDNNGNTPLHIAAKYNEFDVIHLLLDSGANYGHVDKRGLTALHFAALYGCLEATEVLLVRTDNLDIRDRNGRTALNIACRQAQFRIVELLLAYGADLSIPDIHNKTYPQCTQNLPKDFYFDSINESPVRGWPKKLILHTIKVHHLKLKAAGIITDISEQISRAFDSRDKAYLAKLEDELKIIDSLGLLSILKERFVITDKYPTYLENIKVDEKLKQLEENGCSEYMDIMTAILSRDKRYKEIMIEAS